MAARCEHGSIHHLHQWETTEQKAIETQLLTGPGHTQCTQLHYDYWCSFCFRYDCWCMTDSCCHGWLFEKMRRNLEEEPATGVIVLAAAKPLLFHSLFLPPWARPHCGHLDDCSSRINETVACNGDSCQPQCFVSGVRHQLYLTTGVCLTPEMCFWIETDFGCNDFVSDRGSLLSSS